MSLSLKNGMEIADLTGHRHGRVVTVLRGPKKDVAGLYLIEWQDEGRSQESGDGLITRYTIQSHEYFGKKD